MENSPQPVDLENLRTMTDGDVEMEKALFEEFFLSFERGLAVLLENTEDATAETWRQEAHALKGVAMTLGAHTLGMLCKKGQEECHASVDTKKALLAKIQPEYEQVRQFLVGILSAA